MASDGNEELGSLSTMLRQLAGDGEATPLVPGAVIDGTYEIDRAVGEGGMGVVYAARDLKLERDVALKIGSSVSASGLARAGREALALARLSHPNVVVVFGVGEIGGRLYLAMELVTGGNARQWSAAGRRSWREIVALYAAAGDGLVAAHAAGLIHRDFKPDNVLVGADGRPRVADFGLARHAFADETAITDDGEASAGAVTQTGAVVGTPAYMAPEQLAGRELDARADQFSFCASMWEALFGARPFPGRTPAEIAAAISSAPPAVPTGERARRVPRHVTAALARGLRIEPAERWPELRALLAELRRDPATRPRRIAVASIAAVTIGAIAVLALTRGAAEAPCRADPAWLTGVWDPPRRAALERGLAGGGVAGGADTFARAADRLDAYAARWRDARLDACRATHERHEQSDAALDRRIACLDDARAHLGAAVELLSRAPDAALVRRAIDVVGALDDPGACARASGDEPPPPIDPAIRMRLDATAAGIAQAEALRSAGRARQSLPLATAAVAQAHALGHARLEARALLLVASSQDGHDDDAERAYEDAARTAATEHDDMLVARIYTDYVFALADHRARLEDAERILPVAESAVARAGNPVRLAVMVANVRAKIALNRGRLDEGLALSQALVPRFEQAFGADAVEVGTAENNLGVALAAQDKYDDAAVHFARSLAIEEKAYGHDHPAVADALGNLAGVLAVLGRVDDARARLHEVIELETRLYGADSPNLTNVLTNLAMLEHAAHRDADARPPIARAIAIVRATRGADSPDLAAALEIRANIEHAADDPDAAARDYREAIAIYEKAGGSSSIALLGSLVGLGNLANDAGRLDEAEADYRRALAIARTSLGPDARNTIMIEASLDGVLVGRHRYAEAVAAYDALLPREERVFGAEHRTTATNLDNEGMALLGAGRAADGRVIIARSLAIREKLFGPDDALVGKTVANLAKVDRALGRTADAKAEEARAKALAK